MRVSSQVVQVKFVQCKTTRPEEKDSLSYLERREKHTNIWYHHESYPTPEEQPIYNGQLTKRYDVAFKSIGVGKNGGNVEQNMLRKNWIHYKRT